MTEIELKARVQDREALIQRLNSIALFTQTVKRDDEYWGRSENPKKKIRVRTEISSSADGTKVRTCLLTYKRKESLVCDGVLTEVNDEMETNINDPLPLETFLLDNGFTVMLRKHKDVMDGVFPVNSPMAGQVDALFELCNVPPLGDFLEIEILSESNDEDVVASFRKILVDLLELAGISRSCIENRYYSDMLMELEKGGKNV